MIDPLALRESYADRLAGDTSLGRLEADRVVMELFQLTPQATCELSYRTFVTFYRETWSIPGALRLTQLWYDGKWSGALQ